jgi:KDO2-lipid IV(A) lauroyltransferase
VSLPFRLLLFLVRLTPIGLGRRLGSALGWCGYYLLPGFRRRALEGLAVAFEKELPDAARRALARRSLAELGMTLFEFLKTPYLTDEQIRALVPIRGLENATGQERGPAILVSCHNANVILFGAALALEGWRITTVVRPFTNRSLREFVHMVARRCGLGVIERRGGNLLEQCSEVVNRGEQIGLVVDQDAGSKGIFANFFGRPASTFAGPVLLQRRHGLPVQPLICLRLPDGSLEGHIGAPLPMQDTGDPAADDRVNTQRHVELLESHVRRYPANFLWIHRRWKTRPPAE